MTGLSLSMSFGPGFMRKACALNSIPSIKNYIAIRNLSKNTISVHAATKWNLLVQQHGLVTILLVSELSIA